MCVVLTESPAPAHTRCQLLNALPVATSQGLNHMQELGHNYMPAEEGRQPPARLTISPLINLSCFWH
jgi:hypothetical protein